MGEFASVQITNTSATIGRNFVNCCLFLYRLKHLLIMDKLEMAGETEDKSSTSEEGSNAKVSNIVIDESKMHFNVIIRKTLTICI